MLLNYNFYLNYFINIVILSLIYTMYFNLNNYLITWYDIYSRVWLSDFYCNNFYYWWTSFWYIPLFIFLIFIYYLNIKTLQTNILLYIVIIWFLYQIYILIIYWGLNYMNIFTWILLENINNLLTNSVNKYHPLLLYMSSINIFLVNLFFLCEKFFYKNIFFVKIFFFKLYYWNIIQSLILLIVTLSLGGWWALQEGSWGGWWNWDSSEVFGLIIWLFFLSKLHINYSKQNKNFTNWIWFIALLFIIIIYYFLQFNFNLTSHNFDLQINNLFTSFNKYLFLLGFWMYLYITLYILLLKKVNKTQLTFFKFFHKKYYFLPMNLLWINFIILLILYELMYSFIPLWNDFLWKIVNINLSNQIINFTLCNIKIWLLLILLVWNISIFFIIITICNFFHYSTYLLLYFGVTKFRFLWVHLIILIFLWYNLISSYYTYQIWTLNVNTYIKLYNSNLSLLILNSTIIEQGWYFFNLFYQFFLWNYIKSDTVGELIVFHYEWSNQILIQSLVLGISYFIFYIKIYDYVTYVLVILFLFFISQVYYYLKTIIKVIL